MLALLASAAVFYAVGEEAPTSGAGDFLQSDPAPPNFWEDSQTVSKVPLKETGETFSRVETQKVSFHDAVAFDPLWAYVMDVGFTLPTPAPPPEPLVSAAGALTEAQFDAYLQEAGVPVEWWPNFKAIAHCESRWRPGAIGDGGNSIGLMQMWYGWASKAGVTDLLDPVQNLIAAKYVREARGRFGGGGGWTCADKLGIP